MPSIDESDDLEIVILAELAKAAVCADNVLGPEGVASLHSCPMEMAALGDLPAMCIYRLREDGTQLSGTEVQWDVVAQIDYILPATSVHDEQRAKRFPALKNAWHAIVRTLIAGHHEDCRDDARVLDTFGIGIERDGYELKEYKVAAPDSDESSFPYFRATFGFNYVEEGERNATLVAYLRHHTTLVWAEATTETDPDSAAVTTTNEIVLPQ